MKIEMKNKFNIGDKVSYLHVNGVHMESTILDVIATHFFSSSKIYYEYSIVSNGISQDWYWTVHEETLTTSQESNQNEQS